MNFGTIVMCCIIIFLAWLQHSLPDKERQFWSRGKSFCDAFFSIFFFLSVLKQKIQGLKFKWFWISPIERECPTGFLVVRGDCIDFDECKKHNGFCHENVHCMNMKQCRSAVDPLGNFTEIAPSIYNHAKIRTAASPSKFQVTYILHVTFSRVTGSRRLVSSKCENGTVFDRSRPLEDTRRLSVSLGIKNYSCQFWKLGLILNEDSDSISLYAALYHDGSFYLFGGSASGNLPDKTSRKTIARLDTKTSTNRKWSEVG